MNDSVIKYHHGNIAAGAAEITTSTGTLNSTLDQLRTYLQPLVASWTGESAVAYQALQHQWDTAAADLTSMLGAIASTTGQANDGMQSTDRRLAAGW
ncbi:WXG100 family type VII secretion target [Dietzia sp.]|uniref:WXG100 family type VII secretion target n=1 Tax=Dietzia sp. TaxID=1871616 RepID=UPI002FD8E878